MQAIREIVRNEGVTLDEICYVGDDVIDLPPMRQIGLPLPSPTRANGSRPKRTITPNSGGRGAARDAIEFILEAQGTLDQCIEAYIGGRNSISPAVEIGPSGDSK